MSTPRTQAKKVVIPVAGLGTRSLPFSKVVPKELLPIIDKPTIHYVVEEALEGGAEEIIFVTSAGKSALEDYFDVAPSLTLWLEKRGKHELAEKMSQLEKMCEVVSVRQKQPLGLGHAVLCARSAVGKEMFAVSLGDEIFPSWDGKKAPLKTLIQSAAQLEKSVVGVMEVSADATQKYGVIDAGGKKVGAEPVKVKNTVEKPKPADAPSRYAIVGRYVFDPSLFDYLEAVKPGVGGEYQLTDAMAAMAKDGALYATEISNNRFDMGSPMGFLQAQIQEALRRTELEGPLRSYLRGLA